MIETINYQDHDKPVYEILGFINDVPELQDKKFLGYPVLGGSEIISELVGREDVCFINNLYQPDDRKKIAQIFKEAGCKVVSLIHPTVNTSYVNCNVGCIIPEGCIIGPEVKIGSYVAFRNNALALHNTTIGSFCFIGPGAILCGYVTLEERCFIGAGATLIPHVKIGAGSIIGAGSTVSKDIPGNKIAAGTPARIIKNNT